MPALRFVSYYSVLISSYKILQFMRNGASRSVSAKKFLILQAEGILYLYAQKQPTTNTSVPMIDCFF